MRQVSATPAAEDITCMKKSDNSAFLGRKYWAASRKKAKHTLSKNATKNFLSDKHAIIPSIRKDMICMDTSFSMPKKAYISPKRDALTILPKNIKEKTNMMFMDLTLHV